MYIPCVNENVLLVLLWYYIIVQRKKREKLNGKDGQDQYSYAGDKSDGSSDESDTEAIPDQPPPPGTIVFYRPN